ncbi:helix-turn-helix domain-containing protein [Marinicella meishanensis]|uniref:helix-turn-helix domain-containing protein n=1 Tax=Marinicella meishanensis TaxID=2873263 RepID=UPI001CBCDAC5|nr:helix-turn-helix domain-containing protein [Marinicella sp. NBU2979]
MNNSTENPEVNELSSLIKIRENKQLSVAQVAEGMKVSKDFVRYIEEGLFEKLGAPTFLRGHITNYSKVLGLDPSEVLSLVPAQFLKHQELQTAEAMGASPLARVRRQSNHLGRYAVGTALLGMLALSFYFIWDKWSMPERSLTDPAADLAANDSGKKDKTITYSSLLPQVAGPQQNSASTEAATDAEDADETPDADATTVNADEEMGDDTEPNDVPQSPMVMAQESLSDELISEPVYAIRMELQEQAWVSIKTLDGESIVSDLIGPGLREYQSNEPMHFRIGNATKLQLLINDRPVELGEVIKRDVADFEWPLNPS